MSVECSEAEESKDGWDGLVIKSQSLSRLRTTHAPSKIGLDKIRTRNLQKRATHRDLHIHEEDQDQRRR
ncbi:hypothetical protein PAXRUDRAFT_830217 [Paxillus rubicundulus Ve08.2h10]|uniref:Uncharacterized protein n=1 Tax=Paxillus rubicundulus Ve08.2h10 TaxID=930991 RepID=A0A0D0DLG9_9AGAM|nr:hypothetical protein PAXRUDRAFT_830217 [Paxillus rubicundulus Ve08.2h10]